MAHGFHDRFELKRDARYRPGGGDIRDLRRGVALISALSTDSSCSSPTLEPVWTARLIDAPCHLSGVRVGSLSCV